MLRNKIILIIIITIQPLTIYYLGGGTFELGINLGCVYVLTILAFLAGILVTLPEE